MSLLLPTFTVIAAWLVWRSRQARRRAAHIDAFDLARLLDARLAKRRSELDATQRSQAFEALRDWFRVCDRAARKRVGMPSQAVDGGWHEFIPHTRSHRRFGRQARGRFPHHVSAGAMASPTRANEALRRSRRLACRRAGIDPRAPAALPPPYAIDAEGNVSAISRGGALAFAGKAATRAGAAAVAIPMALAGALWINLATWIGAPVSTTHSIVGGVMGAGIAAAGFAAVNWSTMGAIVASWIISPLMGGLIAAARASINPRWASTQLSM